MLVDDIVSRDALSHYIATAGWPEFLFFWGHTAKDRTLGKHVLSQWWEAPFTVAGTRYPTVEHYMMAEKARLFEDTRSLARVLSAATPAEAKKFGRAVQGFREEAWEAHRFDIVRRGNLAKFSQHADLRKWIVAQDNVVFVEASPVDAVWGIGLSVNDADIHDPDRWKGLNLLGFALVAVRRSLKREDAILREVMAALSDLEERVRRLQSISNPHAIQSIALVSRLVGDPTCHLSPCSEFASALQRVAMAYDAEARSMGSAESQDRARQYAEEFRVLANQAIQRGYDPR